MNIRILVDNLLRNQPELRDSDKKLLLRVWEDEGLRLNDDQKRAFMNVTTAESITRARRSLKGKYPASPAVEQRRYELFHKYRGEEY